MVDADLKGPAPIAAVTTAASGWAKVLDGRAFSLWHSQLTG